MLIPNYAFDIIYTGKLKIYNENNILMMFKQVLFDDFDSMLPSSLYKNQEMKIGIVTYCCAINKSAERGL